MTTTSPARAHPTTSPARPHPATSPAPGRSRPAPAPRRHLRPVPERRSAPARAARRHVRPRVALTAAIGVLFAVLFGVAILQTALVQGQLRLDSVRGDLADRQTEAQVLRAEVARLSSPEHIIAEAEGLGLVPPDRTTFLPPPGPGTP